MPEHQQVQQSTESKSNAQKQVITASPTQASNPYFIIQRAKINPKSLTHADIMQLQRTIGNRAVGMLLSGIRSSSTAQQATVQRQEIPEEEETCPSCIQKQETPEEEEPLQGKLIGTIQRQEIPEEEESVQTKMENNTGMPDNLKAGVENLSGIDMSDVRVHYNSDKPAEVGALAYTKGTDIHVAPGQERHLPHEAWHVVQQAQGRVRPTMQLKDVAINEDEGLEREADVMGTRVIQTVKKNELSRRLYSSSIIQRVITIDDIGYSLKDAKEYLTQHESLTEDKLPYLERVLEDADRDNIRKNTWDELILELIHRSRGYDLHDQMSDLGRMKGEQQITWGAPTVPKGAKTPELKKPFYNWLYNKGTEPKKMNCWEIVLFAAWKFGVLDKKRIKEYITRVENNTDKDILGIPGQIPLFVKRVISSCPKPIKNPKGKPLEPKELEELHIPKGFVVVFGMDGQHVAISTGENVRECGPGILELDGDTGGISLSTVKDITSKKAAYATKISWGPFPM